MVIKEYQQKAIEALILNMETIGELYKLYAVKFPMHNEFWILLASEATDQVNWIHKLQNEIKNGSVYFNTDKFNVDRFNIDAIQSVLKYLQQKIAEIKDEEIDMVSASALALDIEKSILEKKFFDIFEVDSTELKHLFLDLAEISKKRRDKIEKLLEEEKRLKQ